MSPSWVQPFVLALEFGTLAELIAAGGPIVIAIGGGIGWFIEQRNARRVRRQRDDLAGRLSELSAYPWSPLKEHLDRHITLLEEQKAQLLREKEEIEERLTKLTQDLEQLYQEHRLPSNGVPGADNEAQVYREQLEAIVAKLDDIRSSILLANSVSEAYQRGRFDSEAAGDEMDIFLERLRRERAAAGASILAWDAHQRVAGQRGAAAHQERQAKAQADEREILEQKAKAVLRRTLDDD